MRSAALRAKPASFDYDEAFSRNVGLVTEEEQSLLRDKRVALPGCGGVGSLHALLLARAGIGKFSLADFDQYELANFNRQFGAKLSTIGKNKAEQVAEEVKDINPTAEATVFKAGVTADNLDAFLDGVDVVVDGLDFFAFEARERLFTRAWERGIAVVTAAPLGFSCALLNFLPGGMSFTRYFDLRPEDGLERKAIKFAMGLSPKATHWPYVDPKRVDLKEGRGPSHAVGVSLCAAAATASALKILLERGEVKGVPHYSQFDAFRNLYRTGRLWGGNRNPWQRLKIWAIGTRLARKAAQR
jgi:sulfur-carrier protein adenylyltransferase/sulfurtransferase